VKAWAAYLLVVLMATGCATTQTAMPAGVVLYEGDRERCETQECTLWTVEELEAFGRYLVDRVCRPQGGLSL
jgi:hypothetical protein